MSPIHMIGSALETQTHTVCVGSDVFQIRSLKDKQQFFDPEGLAVQAGISSSTWPLFGTLWPSGRVLADLMQVHELHGLRVLELGCGLGLASLVIHRRGMDMTASDYHPIAGEFLSKNIDLNQMLPLSFVQCDWEKRQPELGLFDLIIGSDVLYEPNHPALLSGFIDRHSRAGVEVIIVDPNRRQQREFTRDMQALGYVYSMTRSTLAQFEQHLFKGKVMTYRRA
ncbi:MAG: methyltransferase domain-containing protein [Pseudomonadota bacterium]|nr:methyltransferase domain-containing protein [Pseudomonadota bacterium]